MEVDGKFDKVLNRLIDARVKSSAVAPLLRWSFVMAVVFLLAGIALLGAGHAIAAYVAFGLIVLVAIPPVVQITYFTRKDPDRLHHEKYLLERARIALLGKGDERPTVNAELVEGDDTPEGESKNATLPARRARRSLPPSGGKGGRNDG